MGSERPRIVLLEGHDDLYHLWTKAGVHGIDVVHVDPHCDLFGALMLDDGTMCDVRRDNIYEGNFLVPAIKKGIVRKLSWVYDDYGNRRYDDMTVVYEHDPLMRLPWVRARHRQLQRYPVEYEHLHVAQWNQMRPGAHLSLDWDFFAFEPKDRHAIDAEVDAFLKRDWSVVPPVTYLCYSHWYVHPSCLKFFDFATRLAALFDADVELFHADRERPVPPPVVRTLPAKIASRLQDRADQLVRKVLHRAGLHYA